MNKLQTQKGFTLIEILVSLSIFAIIMITASSSYLNIARGQREANAIREMYSEVRYIFNMIGEEARSKTIDYGYLDLQTRANQTYLPLIDANSTERVIFKVEEDENGKELSVLKEFKDAIDPDWRPEPGFERGFLQINLKGIRIVSMGFEKSPLADPFDVENIDCGVIQFQPSVTVYASLEAENESVSDFKFDLRTSFSSRVYNKQTSNL